MRKGDPDIEKVNKILAGISQDERTKIMDQAIKDQPAATDSDEQKTGLINDFKNIWNQYGDMFLRGAGLTLFIALIGTVVGTTLGLLIGVFRTIPDSENPVARFFQKLGNLILSIYLGFPWYTNDGSSNGYFLWFSSSFWHLFRPNSGRIIYRFCEYWCLYV